MNKFLRKYMIDTNHEAGTNISWGSVFAGTLTFLSLSFTLSFIGSAIGFGVIHPTNSKPLEGLGTGLIIWLVITLIISLLGAGFVSGITANRVGFIHGFLTWATSLIVLIFISSFLTISAFSAMGSFLGSISSGIGQAGSSLTDTVSKTISEGTNSLSQKIGNIDETEVQNNIKKVLSDTDVPELQPNFLKKQLDEAKEEIKEHGKVILTNPEKADQEFENLSNSLQKRSEKIINSIDEEAVANAVSKNTDLSKEEAQQSTQKIISELKKNSNEAKLYLEDAKKTVSEVKKDTENTINEIKKASEKASAETAKISIYAFITLVLGMAITIAGGILGVNLVRSVNETNL